MCIRDRLEAVDALMSTLNDYPPYLWGDALGAVVAALFQSKQAAEELSLIHILSLQKLVEAGLVQLPE